VFRAPLCTKLKVEAALCPLTNEWLNKTWYIHMIEYYSALKKEGDSDPHYNMDAP